MAERPEYDWYDPRGYLDMRQKDGTYSPSMQAVIGAMGNYAQILGAHTLGGEEGATAAADRIAQADRQRQEQTFAAFQQLQQQAFQANENRKARQHEENLIQKKYELETGKTTASETRRIQTELNADPALADRLYDRLTPEDKAALGPDWTPETLAGSYAKTPGLFDDAIKSSTDRDKLLNQAQLLGIPNPSSMSTRDLGQAVIETGREQGKAEGALDSGITVLDGISADFENAKNEKQPSTRRTRLNGLLDELGQEQSRGQSTLSPYRDFMTPGGAGSTQALVEKGTRYDEKLDTLRSGIRSELRNSNVSVARRTPPSQLSSGWSVLEHEGGVPVFASPSELPIILSEYATEQGPAWSATLRPFLTLTEAEMQEAGLGERQITAVQRMQEMRDRGQDPRLGALLTEASDFMAAEEVGKAEAVLSDVREVAQLVDPTARLDEKNRRQSAVRMGEAQLREVIPSELISLRELFGESPDAVASAIQPYLVETVQDGQRTYSVNTQEMLNDPKIIDKTWEIMTSDPGFTRQVDLTTAEGNDPNAVLDRYMTLNARVANLPNSPLKSGLLEKLRLTRQLFGEDMDFLADATGGQYSGSLLADIPNPYTALATGDEGVRGEWSGSFQSRLLGTPSAEFTSVTVEQGVGDTDTVTYGSLLGAFREPLGLQTQLSSHGAFDISVRPDGTAMVGEFDNARRAAKERVEESTSVWSSSLTPRSTRSQVWKLVVPDAYTDPRSVGTAYDRASRLDQLRTMPLATGHPLSQVQAALQGLSDEEAYAMFVAPGAPDSVPLGALLEQSDFQPRGLNLGQLISPEAPTSSSNANLASLARIREDRDTATQALQYLGRVQTTFFSTGPDGKVGTEPLVPFTLDFDPADNVVDAQEVTSTSLGAAQMGITAEIDRLNAMEAVFANARTVDEGISLLGRAVYGMFTAGDDGQTSTGGAGLFATNITGLVNEILAPAGVMGDLEGGAPGVNIEPYTGIEMTDSFPVHYRNVGRGVIDATRQLLMKHGGAKDAKPEMLTAELNAAFERHYAQVETLAGSEWVGRLNIEQVPNEEVRDDLTRMGFDKIKPDDPSGNWRRALMLLEAGRRNLL